MKKAIGIVCAIGGAVVLVKKVYLLGVHSGSGIMLGVMNYNNPELHIDLPYITTELTKDFDLGYAMFLSGLASGQIHGEEILKEISKG